MSSSLREGNINTVQLADKWTITSSQRGKGILDFESAKTRLQNVLYIPGLE